MVETEFVARKYMQKLTQGKELRLSKDVSAVVMAAVYKMIDEDLIEPAYETEEEAERVVREHLGPSEIEAVIKRRYDEETRFQSDPAIAVKWAAIATGIEEMLDIEVDRKKIGLYGDISVMCSCGGRCEMVNDARKHRTVWQCQKCGAKIGVHKGTNIPLGVPASGELSKLRIEVHREIDRLVSSGLSKNRVYKILQRKMKLSETETHAGKFDILQCQEALGYLRGMKGGYRL